VPISLNRRSLARRLRHAVIAGGLAAAAAIIAMAAGGLWIEQRSAGRIFTAADVPAAPVALVLGAQVYADGTPSLFLAARLDAAKRLYDTGKVKAILLSGDHSRWDYDEPGSMEVYLVARGVPASRIVLDYAGFDTYDSCARAHRIFGVGKAIVVTQTFHVGRAVALCRDQGIDATGVGDDTVRGLRDLWLRNTVRERLAAVKALYDVTTDRDPVLLWRHEPGVDDALSRA
jgi:vancomycin permeability regulator SanA